MLCRVTLLELSAQWGRRKFQLVPEEDLYVKVPANTEIEDGLITITLGNLRAMAESVEKELGLIVSEDDF